MRKWLGHIYVPGALVPRVDAFLRDTLSPFLNFHRPCLFSVDVTSATGRVKKRYPQAQVATPYDRLRSLPDAERFLRPDVTSRPSTSSPSQPRASRQPRVSSAPATNSCVPSQTRPAAPPPDPRPIRPVAVPRLSASAAILRFSQHSSSQSNPPKHRSRPPPISPRALQVTGHGILPAPGKLPGVCPPALRLGSLPTRDACPLSFPYPIIRLHQPPPAPNPGAPSQPLAPFSLISGLEKTETGLWTQIRWTLVIQRLPADSPVTITVTLENLTPV